MFEAIDHIFNRVSQILLKPAQFLLRFSLGIAFIIHGYKKFPLPPQNLIEYFDFSPFLANFVAISELSAGICLILSGFLKNFIGSIITRISASIMMIIMIFAFYIAHKDWFINSKLFTSEQFFLFILSFYFLIVGNRSIKNI